MNLSAPILSPPSRRCALARTLPDRTCERSRDLARIKIDRHDAAGFQRRYRLRGEIDGDPSLEPRLCGGLGGGGGGRRTCRLVCGRRLVPASLRRSPSSHRDHLEQSGAHRRKLRRLRGRAVSCARSDRAKAEVGRLRADWPPNGWPTRAEPVVVAICASAFAASPVRHRGNRIAVVHGATCRRADRGCSKWRRLPPS